MIYLEEKILLDQSRQVELKMIKFRISIRDCIIYNTYKI